MKNKIYIKEWLSTKPYQKHTETDSYYLEVSNQVYAVIQKHYNYKILKSLLHEKDIKLLSVILVCYFEDIISNAGIWKTFTGLCEQKFGKPLPYYDLNNYERDETNVQDISFLIWNFINTYSENTLINPNDHLAIEFSSPILDLLDKEWQYAPENENLVNYYQLKDYKGKDEFYKVRSIVEKFMFDNWLLSQDFLNEFVDECDRINNDKDIDDDMREKYLYETKDNIVLNSKSKLLNLYGKEWLTHYLGESHELYDDLLNMSKKINGIFKLIDQNSKYYNVEYIATDKTFKLLKSSLDMLENFRYDKLYYLGIVRWKNEWVFSGILSEVEYNQKIIDREKSKPSSLNASSFLQSEEDQKTINDVLDKQLKAFKVIADGELIVNLPAKEVKTFLNQFNAAYHKFLGLSDDEIVNPKDELSNQFDDAKDIVSIFFNPKAGIENYFNFESAFPMKNNIFFDEDYAYDDIDGLIKTDFISPELVKYCFKEFRDSRFYKEYIEKNPWVKDLEFTLAYYRKNSYKTFPKITLTNK